MKREYFPLYVIAVVVLVAGLVVGLILEGVGDGTVPVGTTILGGLMVVLFLLSKRHESDHFHDHDNDNDQHHLSGQP